MWLNWLERILGARNRDDDGVLRADRADHRRDDRPPYESARSPAAERSEADYRDLLTIEDRADAEPRDRTPDRCRSLL